MPLCARPHLRWEGSWREGWRRPYHLASGSCGATHFARCARFVQTVRRKSDVRSALRAPTPRLRCSAPQTSRRLAALRPASACRSSIVGGVRHACFSDREHRSDRERCDDGMPTRTPRRCRQRRGPAAGGAPCAQPKSAAAPAARAARAVHHSRGDCPSAARAASAASFAAPAGAASITGHPREAGASTEAPWAGGPRICLRRPGYAPPHRRCVRRHGELK